MISLFSICLFFILLIPVRFLYNLWWIPFRVKNILQSQGLKGPAYKFIHGNTKEIIEMKKQARSSPMDVSSHDIYPRIHPHLYLWMKLYGNILFLLAPYLFVHLLHCAEPIFRSTVDRPDSP